MQPVHVVIRQGARLLLTAALLLAAPAEAARTPLRVLMEGPLDDLHTRIYLDVDDMKEITWHGVAAFACIEDACPGIYNRSPLRLYYGSSKGRRLPLRLVARLQSSDWVFATTVIIKADGKLHRFAVPGFKWQRDTLDGDGVVEYVDVALSEVNPALVPALCGAKELKVRFDGQGEATYELEQWQVQALRIVCEDWKKWTPAREKIALQAQARLVTDAEKAEREAEAKQAAEAEVRAQEAAREESRVQEAIQTKADAL